MLQMSSPPLEQCIVTTTVAITRPTSRTTILTKKKKRTRTLATHNKTRPTPTRQPATAMRANVKQNDNNK